MSSSLFSALSYLGGSDGGFPSVEKDFGGDYCIVSSFVRGLLIEFSSLFCKGY